MPWRDDPSPYKVWVSEIMLQQTRVTAVIPYFERFLLAFPTVRQLADASSEQVLKAWEGLGYYSRARNLHAAAKIIAHHHGGTFPETEPQWKALPGVGPYTAAAVASIACGQPAAAIDGNVMRVWSRMRAIREDISSAAWREKARQDLIRYARTCDPSLFNQAMMELGALVCLPRSPACNDCPLANNCRAHKQGLTHLIPARKPRKKIPHHEMVALILSDDDGNYLLQQRPHQGLLASFWEFPARACTPAETAEETAQALARDIGVLVSHADLVHCGCVEHAFTHFSQRFQIYLLEMPQQIQPCLNNNLPSKWCTPRDLLSLPLSRSQRRILQQLSSL